MSNENISKVLTKVDVALNDWIVSYAPEFCREEDVESTEARLNERGTLSYIATLREEVSTLLNEANNETI